MEIKCIVSCVWAIWTLRLIIGTAGCAVRWPGSDSNDSKILSEKPEKQPDPDFDSEYPNELEKNTLMMNIQNRMLSSALKLIVDFTIESGGLEFTCPKLNETVSSETYPDLLDCRKYYVCDSNSTNNFTTKRCGTDQGFDNTTLTCVPQASVELCQLSQMVPDFQCNSTGLQPHQEDCSKFILCTKEKLAFVSTCNAGDLFHKSLLVCLPIIQVQC